MGFELPVPPASAVAWAACFAGALKAGGVAGIACTIVPSRAKDIRFPALIEPLEPWVAKIAVDGIAASWVFVGLVGSGGPLGIQANWLFTLTQLAVAGLQEVTPTGNHAQPIPGEFTHDPKW
jgi:hypothetical protein